MCVFLSVERLVSVLDWVGVSVSELSEMAQRCMKSVAGTASALGTRDCSDTRSTTAHILYIPTHD